MLLDPIMNHFLEVKRNFEDISCTHVYREFNTITNQLFKEDLIL
jgi:hypothetical protein